MWNLKCTIIPVIIGATGIVTRSLRKNLEAVPEKHSIDSLQKTAILGTSHIIRKVLQCEAWSLSGGDHRWFMRSTGRKSLWQETSIHNNNNNNNNKELHYYILHILFLHLLYNILCTNATHHPNSLIGNTPNPLLAYHSPKNERCEFVTSHYPP